MSIATGCVIVLTLLILIFSKNRGYHLFLMAGCIGLYTNLGSFMKNGIFDAFTREYFVLSVLVIVRATELIKNRQKIIGKKLAITLALLILSITIGLFNLIYIPSKAFIAPMSVTYDSIVLEGIPLSKASFGLNNISALILFIIFLISVILCKEYFYSEKYVNKTIKFYLNTIKIFFLMIILEAILVNVFNMDNLRKIIMIIFGAIDNSKIYSYSTVRFLGLKSAFGFYSEPSYVSGPLLVFYLINYMKGHASKKNILWFFISFIIAILSGSTNSIVAVFLGIIALVKILLKDKKVNVNKRILTLSALFILVLIAITYLYFNNADIWDKGLYKIYEKLNAYLTFTKTENLSTISGYIRKYGNSVCYNVLKTNPLFGVGLGTTRGYGLISSMLASFGIIGSICIINFYRLAFNIKINRKNIIPFIFLVAVLTGFYSSSHIYSFVLVPIFISFNCTILKDREEQKIECQEEMN